MYQSRSILTWFPQNFENEFIWLFAKKILIHLTFCPKKIQIHLTLCPKTYFFIWLSKNILFHLTVLSSDCIFLPQIFPIWARMNFFNVLLLFHLLRYLEGMRVSLHGTPHDGKDTRSVMLTLVPCICIVKKEGEWVRTSGLWGWMPDATESEQIKKLTKSPVWSSQSLISGLIAPCPLQMAWSPLSCMASILSWLFAGRIANKASLYLKSVACPLH